MTKQKFAKPPQEGWLRLGQIRNYPRNTIKMAEIGKSGRGSF